MHRHALKTISAQVVSCLLALNVLAPATRAQSNGDGKPRTLRGYSEAGSKIQREWEEKMRAIPRPENLRENMKLLFYPDVHEAKVPKKVVELELDLSGQIAGVPDSQFSTSSRLGELLAGSELCQECVVKQVFRYMSGRHETRADAPRLTNR